MSIWEIILNAKEAVIALICVLVYCRTIYYDYVSDDRAVRLQTKKTILDAIKEKIKPVDISTLAKEKLAELEKSVLPNPFKRIWQQFRGAGYYYNQSSHFLTIVVHAAASALVCNIFGFIPGLLFAVLPFSNEVSVWISGHWYGVATIIILLAWKFPLLSPFILLAPGIYLTVLGVPAPLLFLLRPEYTYMSLLAVIIFIRMRKTYIFDPKSPKVSAHCNHQEAWKVAPRKLIIAFKFYGYYFVQGIFGFKCAQFHSYLSQYLADKEGTDKAYKTLDVFFWIGLSLATLLVWWAVNNPVKVGSWIFGLLWFTICIAPFCNAISVGNQLVSMRYSYCANVGLVIFLAHIPYAWIILPGWYLCKLNYVMKQYKGEYWNNVFQIMEEPRYFHSWIIHGNMNLVRGHLLAALQDYEEARGLNPRNFKVYFNMSTVYCALNDIPNAIDSLEKARECDLFAQEGTRENEIEDRERLIAAMYRIQQQGKQVKLEMKDLPFMI